MILVTGCAGFIRSDFVLSCLAVLDELLVNLNLLTYAGSRKDLASLAENRQHIFLHRDIGDSTFVTRLLNQYKLRVVVSLAAILNVQFKLN